MTSKGKITIHMLGMGSKTACKRKITKETRYAPFTASGYDMVTCKQCRSRMKKVVGF
jgi:hypothetical protein